LISWIFLGERLPRWPGWAFWSPSRDRLVITERTAEGEKPVDLRKGLFYGILAALGQSIALVISRACSPKMRFLLCKVLLYA
jgi:hypothetical protein